MMMKNYILSIIAAAIISAIVKSLVGKKTATAKVIELLCGIMMAITVIQPIKDINFYNIPSYFDSLTADAKEYVQQGALMAEKSVEDIIKSQTEAYILDKADRLGLCISVEVGLDDKNCNIPDRVTVVGNISPYAKEVLSDFLQNDLGIAKEKQQWN